jgi:hypothetical protein
VHPIHNKEERLCIKGEKVGLSVLRGTCVLHAFVQGVHSCFGSSLCHLDLHYALLFCRWCRAFCLTLRSRQFGAFCLGCVESLPLH